MTDGTPNGSELVERAADEFELIATGHGVELTWLRHKTCDKRVWLDFVKGPAHEQQRRNFERTHACGPVETRWDSATARRLPHER